MVVNRALFSSTLSCEAVAMPFCVPSRVVSASPNMMSFNSSGSPSIPSEKMFTNPYSSLAKAPILLFMASMPLNVPSSPNHFVLYLSNNCPIGFSRSSVTSIRLTISDTMSSTVSFHAFAASSPSRNASKNASPSCSAMSAAEPPIMSSTISFMTATISWPIS